MAGVAPQILFPWTRLWSSRGDTPVVDRGYLVDPNESRWLRATQTAALKALADLDNVPCLVLLGDPGTGKSVELAAAARRLAELDNPGRQTLFVDLKRRSAALIESEVFQSLAFRGWTEGRHELTIILDSMDECWRRLHELGQLVIGGLKPYIVAPNRRALRLRLSCRAAEWQDEIESDLCACFGEARIGISVQVWQLAPLTEANVSLAATSLGLVGDDFLESVASADVGAFAAHPMTLRMLLESAQAGSSLGRTRAEIYAVGCEQLCRDLHQARQGPARLASSLNTRLDIAERLAAVCVLSNRYLVWGLWEDRPSDDTGLVVIGDFLDSALFDNGPSNGSRELLQETLQTALFDTQANGISTWRHQSYAEFFAGRYLARSAATDDQVAALLCDNSSGSRRIWPQLEETACWIVVLRPSLFACLVGDNADVFVRCDPSGLTDEQRGQLTLAYLEQVRRLDARLPEWSERGRLERLAHPNLANLLRPILQKNESTGLVGELAADIARACNCRELVSDMVDVMLRRDVPDRLRHQAAIAAREWVTDEARLRVRGALDAGGLFEADDADNLRGCVLAILWPSHLSCDELIANLIRPKRDNYSGSYKVFLGDDLIEGLKPGDLPKLLQWVMSVKPDHDHINGDPFDGLCARVTLAGYRALEVADVRAAFLRLMCRDEEHAGGLFGLKNRDIAAERSLRQLFWRDFIAGEAPVVSAIVRHRLRESSLLVHDDFDWIVGEIQSASSEQRPRWIELLFRTFAPLVHPGHLDLIWPLMEADPAIADRVLIYTSTPLIENGRPNWQRKHYYDELERKRQQALRKPLSVQIDEALVQFQGGKPHFMWWIVERLERPVREPDEDGGQGVSEQGWKKIYGEQRTRILNAAPGYLDATPVVAAEVYNQEKEKYYRSLRAGLRLILELKRSDSRWLNSQGESFWSSWSMVLFEYRDRVYCSDSEAWRPLFATAYRCAKPAFLAALRLWLKERSNQHIPIELLEDLPAGTDSELECIILDAAKVVDGTAGNDFDLFGFLLKKNSAAAEACLRDWVMSREKLEGRAVMAEALLLNYRATAFGEEIIQRVMADTSWGTRVMTQLNASGGIRAGWLTELSSESITQLWAWLEKNFPPDPYGEDHDGSVTLDHNLYHLKNSTLNYLAGSGRSDAATALEALARRHPEFPWFGQLVAKARHVKRREDWAPPAISALCAFLSQPRQKPLCSHADLCDALLGSFARYQQRLLGPTPPTELWNEPAGRVKSWSPKNETNLSNCLARFVAEDLKEHSVTVVRESETRQQTGSAPGDEPDIVVFAPSASMPNTLLRVVVEVKCAWNPDVLSSLQEQLYDRYLRGGGCGIHLTGYFTCASWTEPDRRRTTSLSRESFDQARRSLLDAKQSLVTMEGRRVEVVILDCRV